jgi:hypothetical protein
MPVPDALRALLPRGARGAGYNALSKVRCARVGPSHRNVAQSQRPSAAATRREQLGVKAGENDVRPQPKPWSFTRCSWKCFTVKPEQRSRWSRSTSSARSACPTPC